MQYETRTANIPVEVRADASGVVVEGYAAIYNQETVIAGLFREVIRPGAFRSALSRGDDVTLNINHNDNFLLARTTSGTLTLREDEKGLFIRSELDPSDPDVARLVPKMKRGDLSEMSFAFSIPEGGQEWTRGADGLDVREIRDVMLHDVSVVASPAYGGTSIALRSRDDAKLTDDAKAAAEEARKVQADRNAKMAKARIAERKAESDQRFRGIAVARMMDDGPSPLEEAMKWLDKAIKRHERHMDGTESTSEASQQKMMDEMMAAMDALKRFMKS